MLNNLIDAMALRMRVNPDALSFIVALVLIAAFVPLAVAFGGAA